MRAPFRRTPWMLAWLIAAALLGSPDKLQVLNGSAEKALHHGREATRLVPLPGHEHADEELLALVPGTDFEDGTLEIDVSGAPRAGSGPGAKGFVGLAFRVQGKGEALELFYIRPVNSRTDDQAMRNHATQYVSSPGFGWKKLREEHPWVYESYVDLVPGVWTHLEIRVAGDKARLHVNGAKEPTLVVNDLKRGKSRGAVALWAHATTEAHFSGLKITPAVAGPEPLRAAGPDPRAALLVSTAWLAQHLQDPGLVLLHVGDPKEYPAGHLPGARPISLQDVSVSDPAGKGLNLELPPPEALRKKLASLGVADGSRIVLYTGADWVSPTTRIFLTLHWAGLGANTAILDGGMGAWVKDGHPTTTEAPPEPKGAVLSPLKLKEFVVDAAWLKGALGKAGVSVVDGRTAAFFDGVETGGRPPARHKTGHIAGAKSVPFTEVHDEALRLRPANELAALFAKAGVGPDDVVIGYCHIGQQATAMLTAALSLGHPIFLYDGSFQDWSARDLPVEPGKAAKAAP